MAYGLIDISEVGEAEVPLIRVLAESLFGAMPDGAERALERPEDRLMLIAHLEGNPIGFLLCDFEAEWCEIRCVGVLETYRREGTGTRMLQYAERAAKARGCTHAVIHLKRRECDELRRLASSRGFAPVKIVDELVKDL